MSEESKAEIGDRMTSALFLSKHIIKALEIGHMQWAIRHLGEVEWQLSGHGMQLDFSHCHDVVSEVRSAYARCLENGLDSQAQALERSFEKYFSLCGTGTDE